MKTIKLLLTGILAIISTGIWAEKPAKQETYKVSASESTLVWLGKKVTGQHNGSIKLLEGAFVMEGKNIKGGSFTIDMTSITNEDLKDATWNGKLVGHLKSEEFFGVEKFPKAIFELTEAKATDANNHYEVKGKLTIKGITKEIAFPATIKFTGNTMVAVAKIVVDRTQYDIKYGSKSFFEGIGDKAIDNEFTMDVKIIASK